MNILISRCGAASSHKVFECKSYEVDEHGDVYSLLLDGGQRVILAEGEIAHAVNEQGKSFAVLGRASDLAQHRDEVDRRRNAQPQRPRSHLRVTSGPR